MITAEQVKLACVKSGKTWVPLRECSICEAPIGYEIVNDKLFFNGSCDCAWSPATPREWQSVADLINMQSKPEHRGNLMQRFGLEGDTQ